MQCSFCTYRLLSDSYLIDRIGYIGLQSKVLEAVDSTYQFREPCQGPVISGRSRYGSSKADNADVSTNHDGHASDSQARSPLWHRSRHRDTLQPVTKMEADPISLSLSLVLRFLVEAILIYYGARGSAGRTTACSRWAETGNRKGREKGAFPCQPGKDLSACQAGSRLGNGTY